MNDKIGINGYWVAKYSDLIEVKNEDQIIGINYNYDNFFSTEFLYSINDKLIGLVWKGELGSSLFYFLIEKFSSKKFDNYLNYDLKQIVDKGVDKGVDNDLPLDEILEPILKILEDGKYRLFYTFPFPKKITNDELKSIRPKNSFSFFNDDNINQSMIWNEDAILFTQKSKDLNEDRIKFYEKEILAGSRPTIITLGLAEDFSTEIIDQYEHSPRFILDGHHKAQAYHNLMYDNNRYLIPSVLSISLIKEKTEIKGFNKKWRDKIEAFKKLKK